MRKTIAVCVLALFAGMTLAGCANNDGTTPTPPTTASPTPGGGQEDDGMAEARAALAQCADTQSAVVANATTPGQAMARTKDIGDAEASSGGAKNPTTYTIMSAGEAESLDPAYDYESAGGQIITNIYETLYSYSGPSAVDLVPVLASNMPGYNEDRTQLTIKLRENVTFHNGNPLTADDVKYSLDRIIIANDPDSPASIYYVLACAEEYGHLDVTQVTAEDRANYLRAGAVSVVDDHTVVIKLAYPDPSFLYRLAFQAASIVDKETFCQNAPAGFVDCMPALGETRNAWADDNEMGTGPFMLERWSKGQEIVLKRFDDYWGEKPALERVVVKKVGDFNTRLTALKSGDADDVYIPVDHDKDVQGLPNVDIIEDESWSVSFIGFNQAFCGGPQASGYQECMSANGDAVPKDANGQPAPLLFSDINMRKAWALAFDYGTYLENIVNNHGTLLNGVLPKGIFGYDANLTAPKRDLEAARAALAQTNYSEGFQVTIYFNSDNTVREKTAQLLAQNIMEICDTCEVTAQGLDWSTAFLPKQRAKALPVFYLGWLPDYAFPDNYVVPFAHGDKGVYAKRVGYANSELDEKIDAMLRETDTNALKTGYREIAQELNDDYVYMWLAQATNFHVQRDWVGGYYYNPMHSGSPQAGDFSTLSKKA